MRWSGHGEFHQVASELRRRGELRQSLLDGAAIEFGLLPSSRPAPSRPCSRMRAASRNCPVWPRSASERGLRLRRGLVERLEPDLRVSTAAWLTAGVAHHTVMSKAVDVEVFRDFAKIELVVIDADTTLAGFQKQVRWNQSGYRLIQGLR